MNLNLIPIHTKSKRPASKYLPLDTTKNPPKPSWKIPIPYSRISEILKKDPTLNIAATH